MACRLVCVSDSSLLIDLRAGRLLTAAFRLPWDWLAPDVVIAELRSLPVDELMRPGLRQIELPGREVRQVEQLAERYRRPSRTDLFALVAARMRSAILLTGDRHLRRAAEQEGVSVHGVLWLVDELVRLGIVTGPDAAAALRAMVEVGSRLPKAEVAARIERYTSA